MKRSASVDVIWKLASIETAAGQFPKIQPEHFLLGLLKFAELPAHELPNLGVEHGAAQQIVQEIAGIARELETLGIRSTKARRDLRGLLGLGDSPYHGRTLHRTPESRELMNAAARLASDRGSDTLTASHLLQAILVGPTPPMLLVLGDAAGKPPQPPDPSPAAGEAAPASLQDLAQRLRALRDELLAKVFGQEHAVHDFVEGLFNAEVVAAADEERRAPRALFVFAGPPGVGKTFLAEMGAARMGRPFKRFDMSAYSSSYQGDALVGMAKSYHGAHPGLLTEFVEKQPDAVLLFDEIEKAHASTIHLFLQILDAGTLEDKYHERNVQFRDTTIIFTTNAGRKLYDQPNASGVHRASAAFHRRTILDALASEQNPLTKEPFFPAAICSRMATGYPVLFNHLQVSDLERVVRSELARMAALFEKQYGKRVTYQDTVPMCLVLREGGGGDARTLRSQAEAFVKAEIFKFCRLFRAERLDEVLQKVDVVHFTVEGDPRDLAPEVRTLFEKDERPRVLLVAGEKWTAFCHEATPQVEWLAANTPEDALQVLAAEEVDVALLDLWLGRTAGGLSMTMAHFDNVPAAARGLDQGQELLRRIHERLPGMPVYLLSRTGAEGEAIGNGAVDEELLLACIRAGGANGVLTVDLPEDTPAGWKEARAAFASNLLTACRRLHQERAAEKLGQERKVLSFETAPQMGRQQGEVTIRLRRLSLARAIAAADAGEVMDEVERPRVRFEDVIGADSAKEELQFFIDYLKNPRRFAALGLKPPKGVLLYGPPGTGKTMLARALAGESDVAFLTASASSFVTIWQGSGPQNVRDLFDRARRYAPAILFIDEIDAIGRARTGGASGEQATENTLNALLTEMDGFTSPAADRPLFILAATNLRVQADNDDAPERSTRTLDPALVRRFARSILVYLPDTGARRKYLTLRMGSGTANPIAEGILDLLAEKSAGMSISNLEQVIETAARTAARQGVPISGDMLLEALDTAREGEAKEWSPQFLESTARHEAGHTVMYWLSGWWSPEVSIVARSDHGGGMRRAEDEMKRESLTRDELLASIRVSLGGRAAEVLCYGEKAGLTTGASGDLQHATQIARQMICRYGMTEEFGLLAAPELLQRAEALGSPLYEQVSRLAVLILKEQMEQTLAQLRAHEQEFDKVTQALLQRNRLYRKELQEILPKLSER